MKYKMKYLKLFERYGNERALEYDDSTFFTQSRLYGRHFETEEDAIKYLTDELKKFKTAKFGGDKNYDKEVDDFIIIDTNDGTLKPYIIREPINQKNYNRYKATEFIKQNGIFRSKAHPIVAYIPHNKMSKLKELGIDYQYIPIQKADLLVPLSNFLRKDFNVFIRTDDYGKKYLYFYDLYKFNRMGKIETKEYISKIEKSINEFNTEMGTEFYIKDIKNVQTQDSILRTLEYKLKDEVERIINRLKEPEETYESINIYVDRYKEDEDEFMAKVLLYDMDRVVMRGEKYR